jgi:hypothetical protein
VLFVLADLLGKVAELVIEFAELLVVFADQVGKFADLLLVFADQVGKFADLLLVFADVLFVLADLLGIFAEPSAAIAARSTSLLVRIWGIPGPGRIARRPGEATLGDLSGRLGRRRGRWGLLLQLHDHRRVRLGGISSPFASCPAKASRRCNRFG